MSLETADERTFATGVWAASTLFGAWIGLYQAADACEPGCGWRWVSGVPLTDSDWAAGEPNNEGGSYGDEDHAMLAGLGWGGGPGRWVDWPGATILKTRAALVEWSADCNADGIVDYGQCRDGSLPDYDGDNIPDCCESGTPCEIAELPIEWSVEDGGNGHWYQLRIISPSVSWESARSMAIARGGHLATATSAAESNFLFSCASNVAAWTQQAYVGPWLGGRQHPKAPGFAEPDGGWVWETGEPWSFTNWDSANPSNGPSGPEDYLHLSNYSGQWNDIRLDGEGNVKSLLIEWSADCNEDGLVDFGQVRRGVLADLDRNNVPDCCEIEIPCGTEGRIIGWGRNDYGQGPSSPPIDGVVAISAGLYHNLALHPNGAVSAWGWNASGQCNVPADLGMVVDVAAGYRHSISLSIDGSVRCWGSNDQGQCNVPPDVGLASSVGVGDEFTIVVRANGTLRCWGRNVEGQCNVPASATGIVEATGGAAFAVARRLDGTVLAWGRNDFGQATVPADLGTALQVVGGAWHGIALRSDRSVACWGRNEYGQLNVPADLGPVREISGHRGNTTVALLLDGTVRAWGSDGFGEAQAPEVVYRRISQGGYHGIGIEVYCPADINQSGTIDAEDLAYVLFAWGMPGSKAGGADINGDATVDANDLSLVLGSWGPCP